MRDPRIDPKKGDIIRRTLWTAVMADRVVVEVTPTHVTFAGYTSGTVTIEKWRKWAAYARVVKVALDVAA